MGTLMKKVVSVLPSSPVKAIATLFPGKTDPGIASEVEHADPPSAGDDGDTIAMDHEDPGGDDDTVTGDKVSPS